MTQHGPRINRRVQVPGTSFSKGKLKNAPIKNCASAPPTSRIVISLKDEMIFSDWTEDANASVTVGCFGISSSQHTS